MTVTADTTSRICPVYFSCYNDGRFADQWVDYADTTGVDTVRNLMDCSAAGCRGTHDVSPRRSYRYRTCFEVSEGAMATGF